MIINPNKVLPQGGL